MGKFLKSFLATILAKFYNYSFFFNKKSKRKVSASDFFDKVYIVTIERNHDRQEQMRKHLTNKLVFELFMGVDGRKVTSEEIKKNYDETKAVTHYRSLSIGEIGCSWSHRKVYETCVEANLKAVLVIEDDARIQYKKLPILYEALGNLPEDWDLLYLGYKDGELKGHFPNWIFPRIKNDRIVKAEKYKKYLMRAGSHELTVGYALSRKGAEKLLKIQTPIQFTSDGLLEYACERGIINAFIIVPKLIFPAEDVASSIWST